MQKEGLKLLVLPSWYPPNGGNFFVNQTKWLVEQGVDASVVSVEDRGVKQFSLRDTGRFFRPKLLSYHGIPTYRQIVYRIPFLIRQNEMLWIRSMTRLCDKYIRKYGKPDIIQVHSCMWAGVVAARIKNKYGIPYLITEHRGRFNQQSCDFKNAYADWHLPLLKEALVSADTLIPVSANMIPMLEEFAGRKLRANSLPNPVNESLFQIKGQRDWGAVRLINISAFTSWKALDILIHAFHQALKKRPYLELHLVGDGPDFNSIQELADKLGIKEQVVFYGMLNSQQVHEKLLQSDIMVLSSKTEGQPVVIGESILSGLPVITTDVVSLEDVPEFAGRIVEKNNPMALANSILETAEHLDQYAASKIREFGMKRFSKTAVIKAIIEVMQEVVSKSRKES